jgi:OOP family OmpA-OmpF porin
MHKDKRKYLETPCADVHSPDFLQISICLMIFLPVILYVRLTIRFIRIFCWYARYRRLTLNAMTIALSAFVLLIITSLSIFFLLYASAQSLWTFTHNLWLLARDQECERGAKNTQNKPKGIIMSNFKISYSGAHRTLLQSALVAVFSVAALAPATSMAQAQNDPGHWYNSQGIVWKNSTGLCWRSGAWTPANATAECDPELMAKAEVPAEKHVETPAPAPEPIAARMQTRKITFSAEELFDFDKAILKPAGKAGLDKLTNEINGVNYETVLVTGHADRVGSNQYNQKLSERRTNAVKAYLLSKGIPDSRITASDMGETQPVTKMEDCKGPTSKKLIACLQPDRRVEVDVTGSTEVIASQ